MDCALSFAGIVHSHCRQVSVPGYMKMQSGLHCMKQVAVHLGSSIERAGRCILDGGYNPTIPSSLLEKAKHKQQAMSPDGTFDDKSEL